MGLRPAGRSSVLFDNKRPLSLLGNAHIAGLRPIRWIDCTISIGQAIEEKKNGEEGTPRLFSTTV
jgi:hypothetical protein